MLQGTSEFSLDTLVDAFTVICGAGFVISDPAMHYSYERDEAMGLRFPFDLLIRPGTAEEVAAVLALCNRHRVPVTPRGAGSGVTGGALPVKGGVVLSLERLNRIIELNEIDGYIVAEAGVITADLCEHVAGKGLYFPVAPSSSAYSFLGGNVAQNAGSISSCRYGNTDRYVLNLQVALPSGEMIWTGANVSKNVTGFNLTGLLTGSEGVLGIITKVVYRLLRKPAHEVSLLAAFAQLEDACNAVTALKRSGIAYSAVELIGSQALALTAAYLNEPLPLVNEKVQAHLLINLSEDTDSALFNAMETTATIIERFTTEQLLTATTAVEKERLWKLRFSIGAALMSEGGRYRDIDICVPLSVLSAYIDKLETVSRDHGLPLIYFGHAMDGNLHAMVRLSGDAHVDNEERLSQAIHIIYDYAIRAGGVISGEHGIGLMQKEFMPLQFSPVHLSLMQQIKQVFDPNGILNPGKIF